MKHLLSIFAALALVCVMAVPAFAEVANPDFPYLVDDADILTDSEESELEERARAISETYGCAVYIVTVDDYNDYSTDSPYEAGKAIYKSYDLGWGNGRDGEMLLLSMTNRKYGILAYGDFGNASFTDYGKQQMEAKFVERFKENDWYGGFESYLDTSEKYLRMSSEGAPYDVDNTGESDFLFWVIGAVVALLVSFAICQGFMGQLNNAREKDNADDYIPVGGIKVTRRKDHYTHTTVSRVAKSKSNGGGGTSTDSSGFSGGSGSF